MNIKLYIGTDLADFNDVFNVMFSIGDIRELSFGNNNKTYTLNLPLTKTNKRLLSYISQPDVKSETDKIGRLLLGELLIIQGKILITDCNDYAAKIIINSDDWIDALSNKKLTALDLSAHDHTLTHANVENSWSAAYPFYRYPMINFGALASGETGSAAKWSPNDFIPMFQVTELMTHILLPYTISSTHLALNAIKDLYIMAQEKIADSAFIEGKELHKEVQLLTDNQVVDTIDGGITKDFTLADGNMVFHAGTDEAVAWDSTNEWYVVPVTGTYHFTFTARPVWASFVGITINSQQQILSIQRTRGGSTDTLVTRTDNFVSTDILSGITYTIASGYVHFEAGDKVFCTRYMTQNLTNSGVTRTITMSYTVTTTSCFLTWNKVCLYAGIGKTISAEEMLPDISQLDFLAAVRDVFNLRFRIDKFRQVIYIEPWNQYLTSTVIDLTTLIDFSAIDTELISKEYNKNIVFKWKDDTGDKAYEEYLKTSASLGKKELVLNSIYTKPGTQIKEHLFSSIITGINWTISLFAVLTPRIWNEVIDLPPIVFERKVGFNTRIVEWKGLTAGFTWYFEGDTKNTYPKIQGLDWSALFTSYWMKTFHYIDKGKLFTVRMKVKAGFLTQFFTVVNASASEGFRPTYQITINGIKNYFFLQKVTSDGNIAELEMVLRQ
jgi:hypothetical protein